MPKQYTICLASKDDRLLLGLKKRGFGIGRWNGFGGKVNEDESIEQAAIRELYEESGIVASSLTHLGILEFAFQQDPKQLEVHIFRVDNFSGEILETEEMKPRWFRLDQIPYDQMWSDDRYWLPIFLAGKKFRGRFIFDRPSDETFSAAIIEHELNEVDEF